MSERIWSVLTNCSSIFFLSLCFYPSDFDCDTSECLGTWEIFPTEDEGQAASGVNCSSSDIKNLDYFREKTKHRKSSNKKPTGYQLYLFYFGNWQRPKCFVPPINGVFMWMEAFTCVVLNDQCLSGKEHSMQVVSGMSISIIKHCNSKPSSVI